MFNFQWGGKLSSLLYACQKTHTMYDGAAGKLSEQAKKMQKKSRAWVVRLFYVLHSDGSSVKRRNFPGKKKRRRKICRGFRLHGKNGHAGKAGKKYPGRKKRRSKPAGVSGWAGDVRTLLTWRICLWTKYSCCCAASRNRTDSSCLPSCGSSWILWQCPAVAAAFLSL